MNKKIDFDYYANYFAMIEERLVNTEKYIAFEKKEFRNIFIRVCKHYQ